MHINFIPNWAKKNYVFPNKIFGQHMPKQLSPGNKLQLRQLLLICMCFMY